MLSEAERAFLDTLYRDCFQPLLLHSFGLLGYRRECLPLAEDCVQETFVIALEKMPLLLRHEAPMGWLMSTCHRITLARRRKLLGRRRILGQPLPLEGDLAMRDPRDAIAEWLAEEQAVWKRELLEAALTQEELQVFRLKYGQGMTADQTSKALSLTQGAVRGALRRIREKARGLWLKEQEAAGKGGERE